MKTRLDPRMTQFAAALNKVKQAYDSGQEVTLSWLETTGIIYGVQVMSANVKATAADDSAERMTSAGATETNG